LRFLRADAGVGRCLGEPLDFVERRQEPDDYLLCPEELRSGLAFRHPRLPMPAPPPSARSYASRNRAESSWSRRRRERSGLAWTESPALNDCAFARGDRLGPGVVGALERCPERQPNPITTMGVAIAEGTER
jgi:hypothetical protein